LLTDIRVCFLGTGLRPWAWKEKRRSRKKTGEGRRGRPREESYPEKWLREEIKKTPQKFSLKEKQKTEKEL
jgi:hypothetical protein